MKILKLVNDLGYGGTQRCAQNYAIKLKRKGHDVFMLAYSELGPRAAELEKEEIPVMLLKSLEEVQSRIHVNPDVIHIHREGAYNKLTTELLVKLRDDFPQTAIVETNVFSRVDWFLPRGTIDLHFQLSDWCLIKYLKWAQGIDYDAATMVVPNLFDDEKFVISSDAEINAFLYENNIPEGSVVFGRVGQSIESKWNTCVIDAFRQADIQNSYLVLVSAPPSHINKVERLPPKIKNRVRLIDFIKNDIELNRAYSSFDFFVHASKIGESFGMVLVESILCGTPVITLSTPLKDNSQSLLIPDCNSGYVVQSTCEFAKAMQDAAYNNHYWKEKRSEIRKSLITKYGPKEVISRLELGYERALKLRKSNDLGWESEYLDAKKRVKAELRKHSLILRAKFEAVHNPLIYKIYQDYRRKR